jgi:signal transduction histidine kinase
MRSQPAPPAPPATEVEWARRFRAIRRSIIRIAWLLASIIVSCAAAVTVVDYRATLLHNEQNARSLTRALEQHTARVLDDAGQLLADMRDAVETNARGGPPDLQRLEELMRTRRMTGRLAPTAFFVDQFGRRRVGATAVSGADGDSSAREYFVRHRASADPGITLTPPFRGRVSGHWVLPVSARVEFPDGTFAGVAVVGLDVAPLVQFYRSLDLPPGSSVAVMTADGTYFLRYPDFERAAAMRATAPDAAHFVRGTEGSVVSTSPIDGVERIASFRKVNGYPVAVVVGYPVREVLRPWIVDTAVTSFTALAMLAMLAYFTRILLRRADAQHASVVEVLHRDAHIQSLNEALERRVEERTGELIEANRDLESFGYAVSHDLRAPLRHLSGYAEMLGSASTDDAMRARLPARIVERARYMSELIEGLLNLSHIGRVPLADREIDLTSMAQELVEELRATDAQRQVEVAIAPHLHARGDGTLVRTLLQNLLGNAWKYSSRKASARIELGALRADGTDAFFVKDNGAGFDPRFTSRLFGTFQRLHTASEFPGTGIGLATCARIVRRHGGRIWATAIPEVGACFYFTLPRSDADAHGAGAQK